jgi:DNA-binding NtrC family response regulator
MPRLAVNVKRHCGDIQILAIVPARLRPMLAKQLAPLEMTVVCAERASEIGQLINDGKTFQVAILPAASSHAEWWALWGELCLMDPRPEILVYAQSNSFQLWTAVLDMGGFDVLVEPFSDREIQEAVLRAVQSFKKRGTASDSPQ